MWITDELIYEGVRETHLGIFNENVWACIDYSDFILTKLVC